ncbi:hypothetical protein [Cystobacter fuscus]|uniref:hypothetical protein n=1 Tax=Cystobacter fuscus TaxID=43 RepID=UPI0037C02BCA
MASSSFTTMIPPRTQTLYRPVGLLELELILDAGSRAFPPRLPEQPIFYPVLNSGYAEQIARDWNPPDVRSGFAGYVTSFEVEADYLLAFDVKVVGDSRHQELWVPAGELPAFNAHLASLIQVSAVWYGASYTGPVPTSAQLQGLSPREQLRALDVSRRDDPAAFQALVQREWKLVFCNHALWRSLASGASETRTCEALAAIWRSSPRAALALPECR